MDVVSDLEIEVAHDVAAPTDHAAVADADDRVGHHGLAGDHPRGDAHVRSDQRVATDVDPPLAEERPGRKGQAGTAPERTKAAGYGIARSARTVAGHPVPSGVHHRVEEPVAGGSSWWHGLGMRCIA
jgi:hypothetical protein